MSKLADTFASDPIVIAKAITRAVKARRAAARYVAPRSQHAIFLASTFLPRVMWDWAMRKVGHLNEHNIDFTARRTLSPQPWHAPATPSSDHAPVASA
jgi:hypothetical protein